MTGASMNDSLQIYPVRELHSLTVFSNGINFDLTFIEEAVFLLMRDKQGDNLYRDFCDEKERIYQQDISNEERDKAFKLLYEKYFCRLGLEDFFKNICKDFSHLHKPEIRVVVKRVWNKKHEEAELYVQPSASPRGEPHQKTVYLGILVRRVLDLAFLESFLRHELTRISDMLSFNFQYSPHPVLGGKNGIEDNLIRERFRLLWDFYIDARLRGKGFKTNKSYEEQKKEFERKFFFLTPLEREQILTKIRGCEGLMQIDLLSWAGDPRSVKILGEGGLRCPLCDFTSYDSVKNWTIEAVSIADRVKNDYPDWDPSQGICPQCFDIYGGKFSAKP